MNIKLQDNVMSDSKEVKLYLNYPGFKQIY